MSRDALRSTAYASGAIGLRHRLRHADTLTVAMFHRVVDPASQAARHADPIYTLPAPLFAACLPVFRRHYAVVSLAQVQAAIAGGAALPARALLLTFDDGWQDFATTALPLLHRAGMPATVFLATDAIATPGPWWQEVLLRALREGHDFRALWANAGGTAEQIPQDPPPLALLLRYAALTPDIRARAIAPLRAADLAAEGDHMLGMAQMPALAAQGVDFGGHGAAHLPMSLMADPAGDLARCRAALGPQITALSFPHGRYNSDCVQAARREGFATLFTSDACINAAPGGRPAALLGRISVEASAITDAHGTFDAARLAAWLMHRPVRAL